MSPEIKRPESLLTRLDVETIVQELSLEEKVAMMSGSGFYRIHSEAKKWGAKPYPAGGANERLGIEGLKFSDGPRGVIVGNSTCFPCAMARGATFDRDLEKRVGEAMGKEARAQGVNLLGNICINILRHPAWGRAQETYGEDSYHIGEMGVALSNGTQHHNVIATVKHFAVNSLENTRFKLDVSIEDRTLREIYLPHFRKVIDAGCLSVMSAYNKVNGVYCGQNSYLLSTILRDEWGFEGFVHSDWVLGVYSPHGAEAGLDIENPEPAWFGDRLLSAIQEGEIDAAVVDRAASRILAALKTISEAKDPISTYTEEMVASKEHALLAREVAEKSAVLLKNESVLPLAKDGIAHVAVCGRLATMENTGDHGSSRVRAPYTITPLQGLEAYLGEERVAFVGGGEENPDNTADLCRNFDAAIVVVGYTADDEGEYIPSDVNLGQDELPETLSAILNGARQRGAGRSTGGDRHALSLPKSQVALVRAVARQNPRTIVVIVAGSAVTVEEWIDEAPAVLQTFYSGMEGGSALARLIFGDVSPSGHLPFTVARSIEQYPFFDRTAERITYGYWHGYHRFDNLRLEPRFPFGFGLTYSKFEYSGLGVSRSSDGGLDVVVSIQNVGECQAIETPQLYLAWPGRAAMRPKKSLRGFARVNLAPGESQEIRFRIKPIDLAWFDCETHSWRIEKGEHGVVVGRSSRDSEALFATIEFEMEVDLGV